MRRLAAALLLLALTAPASLAAQDAAPPPAPSPLTQARTLINEGKPNEALRTLDGLDPADPLVGYLQGVAFYHADEPLKAIASLPEGTGAREPARGDDEKRSPIAARIGGRDLASRLPPLDHPECRPAARATHMREEDLVLGVVAGGQARAYPWWVVKNYHVVNDAVGGIPLVVAFCEQCTGGAAFRRDAGGRVLSMEVAGVYNGTILLKDRETGTLWAPFSGRALEGPRAGETLPRLPLLLTHWDEWTALHPETDVVWASARSREGHGAWYHPGKWGIVNEMGVTIETWDPRLPENTLVYGVGLGTSARAYPLSRVAAHGGVVNDQVAGTPIVVVARGSLGAVGYARTVEGRILTFRPATTPEATLADEETGTSWSRDGRALSGPLRGKELAPLDGYPVEWHVWSAYNPQTEIFETPPGDGGPTPADHVFPSLTLEDLDGDAPRTLLFPGRVNVVALWAAWCPPCREEMPALQRLVDRYATRGLSAVGIAIHIPEPLEREAVRTFRSEARITFPTLLVDDAAYDKLDALGRTLGGPGLVLPTVFVTDAQARILAYLTGKDVGGLPTTVAKLLDGHDAPAR